MNVADRFGFSKPVESMGNIAIPPSPSASVTKMANQLKTERQDDKSEVRGEVTPSAIRKSMKPIRDYEFEYLKKFQTELFHSIVRAKEDGLYQADFTLTSREIDEYTLDFVFDRLIKILRLQKFFVAIGNAAPRSFVVSWDPILTPESITPEELNNPNSIASIRTRRFARLQKKNYRLVDEEKKVFEEFQEYKRIMKESPEQFRNIEAEAAATVERGRRSTTVTNPHALQIDDEAIARRALMSNMLDMARFKNYSNDESFYGPAQGETSEELKAEALDMIRAANQVVE